MTQTPQTTLDDIKLYWKRHLHLVQLLGTLGHPVHAVDRIEPFKLKTLIRRKYHDQDPMLLADIAFLLDSLVEMRLKGVEPPHDGKRYTL